MLCGNHFNFTFMLLIGFPDLGDVLAAELCDFVLIADDESNLTITQHRQFNGLLDQANFALSERGPSPFVLRNALNGDFLSTHMMICGGIV